MHLSRSLGRGVQQRFAKACVGGGAARLGVLAGLLRGAGREQLVVGPGRHRLSGRSAHWNCVSLGAALVQVGFCKLYIVRTRADGRYAAGWTQNGAKAFLDEIADVQVLNNQLIC